VNDRLVNSIGQSLMAVGLYIGAFESLILTVKDQMQGYLISNEPNLLKAICGYVGTSNSTFEAPPGFPYL